jgi:hypothetical protein
MALTLVKPTIAELRQLIGAVPAETRPRHSFSLYPSGFHTGSFVELTGTSRTEFITLFLRENAELNVAWVEESITINPYAMKQKGVVLDNILFIEAGKNVPWCLSQVLGSGCFQILVTENSRFTEKDLRRFQLLSEKSQSHFFLLSETPTTSWVPNLQLKVAHIDSHWDVQSLRKRGAL